MLSTPLTRQSSWGEVFSKLDLGFLDDDDDVEPQQQQRTQEQFTTTPPQTTSSGEVSPVPSLTPCSTPSESRRGSVVSPPTISLISLNTPTPQVSPLNFNSPSPPSAFRPIQQPQPHRREPLRPINFNSPDQQSSQSVRPIKPIARRSSNNTYTSTAIGEVVIVRGVPGTGKSTYAQSLRYALDGEVIEPVIVSADDFFQKQGFYQFDVSKLAMAHNECKQKFLAAIRSRQVFIVVDNGNAMRWEYAPFVELAERENYFVRIVEFACFSSEEVDACHRRNVHNVPPHAMANMLRRWQPDERAEIVRPVFTNQSQSASRRSPPGSQFIQQ